MTIARKTSEEFGPWRTFARTIPFRLVVAGLMATFVAEVLHFVPGSLATFLQVLCICSGLLLAGGAVWWQLRCMGETFDERARSALIVAGAGAVVQSAYVAMDKSWDSLRLAVMVLQLCAIFAAGIVLLPSAGRRIAVSVLIVLHFAGILTAVTAVELPNNTAPWVPTTLWARIYRPYLTFMYLNNAYHFYSPEPGPPTLVWFLVEFEDGAEPEWVKLISRDQCATRLQYQRLLALTESTNRHTATPAAKLTVLWQRLSIQADRKGIKLPAEYMSDLASRYREPTDDAKKYISSYVRHVARTVRSKQKPDARIKGIKVYRIVHQLINAWQFEQGMWPTDPVLFFPYFQGEYDTEGRLKDFHEGAPFIQWMGQGANGKMQMQLEKAQDPFLYWLLPIYRLPINPDKPATKIEEMFLIDCFKAHAGVPTGLEEPARRKKD